MENTKNKKLILASGSPRRKELVQLLDWTIEIAPADIDETVRQDESATDYVSRMAIEKALVAAAVAPKGALIIAADTTVADGSDILGKPQSKEEAKTMLGDLKNKKHKVYTALTMVQDGVLKDIRVESEVPMRNYSDEEMLEYIASGDPFDKAGGYAIQHEGFHPVENFDDCFANVMGLPVCDLAVLGTKFGLEFPEDLPIRCQKTLSYECTCFSTHLRGTL